MDFVAFIVYTKRRREWTNSNYMVSAREQFAFVSSKQNRISKKKNVFIYRKKKTRKSFIQSSASNIKIPRPCKNAANERKKNILAWV